MPIGQKGRRRSGEKKQWEGGEKSPVFCQKDLMKIRIKVRK